MTSFEILWSVLNVVYASNENTSNCYVFICEINERLHFYQYVKSTYTTNFIIFYSVSLAYTNITLPEKYELYIAHAFFSRPIVVAIRDPARSWVWGGQIFVSFVAG